MFGVPELADAGNQIDLAYRLALCRPPKESEKKELLSFLKGGVDTRAACEQMCRVILNLNEFVYSD